MWVFVIAVIIIIARLIVISSDNDRPSNNNKPIIRFTESIEEKGTRGEREVSQIVAWSCYGSNAIPIKNLYLPWPDGSTAQIDELIIADSGIYVIEMKNYKGWIFGNENNKYWPRFCILVTEENLQRIGYTIQFGRMLRMFPVSGRILRDTKVLFIHLSFSVMKLNSRM